MGILNYKNFKINTCLALYYKIKIIFCYLCSPEFMVPTATGGVLPHIPRHLRHSATKEVGRQCLWHNTWHSLSDFASPPIVNNAISSIVIHTTLMIFFILILFSLLLVFFIF
ncbi:hypothetical protein ISN45_At01g021660 [Arabidopsis thaliana x Arabidopsis arenosa]|uniref:Transmembrane protein n=1 Tax=Arabidopsis thaliana x Arabidopsis arenosa TaxID=1240361 RepID=A0A8T2GIF3_9BRAS|nr:hypothetical protein ISN45_At01g021660 [Arabidopsis thaliana x Arabidopsis arenosa]